jgi:hypothetical protein
MGAQQQGRSEILAETVRDQFGYGGVDEPCTSVSSRVYAAFHILIRCSTQATLVLGCHLRAGGMSCRIAGCTNALDLVVVARLRRRHWFSHGTQDVA